MVNKKRIDYIDCAKGIGILLVIIGHTVTNDAEAMHQAIRGGIFSFHMPMFFTLSCMTYRLSADRDQFVRKTERAFRHLIIPMLVTYGIIILIQATRYLQSSDVSSFIIQRINALIYASGVKVNVMDTTIPPLGMLWFMVALFIGRTMYDYMSLRIENRKLLTTVIVILAVLGVGISRIMWLPLSFDIVLAVLPFMMMGTYLGRIDLDKHFYVRGGGCATAIWAVTLYSTWHYRHAYMELAIRRYPLIPLCFVTAAAGTIAMIYLCKWLTDRINIKGLLWLGRNSMWVYLIHAIDSIFMPLWRVFENNYVTMILRCAIDIAICLFFMKLRHMFCSEKGK